MSRSNSPSKSQSSEPMHPETFAMLKQIMDSVARLTDRIGTLESRPTPIATPKPRSTFELGGTSRDAPRETAHESPQRTPQGQGMRHANPLPRTPNVQGFVDDFQEPQEDVEEEGMWREFPRRHPQPRRGREYEPFRPYQELDGIGKVKVKIPSFEGKCDPDAYMDWETKLEQIWSCHHFGEQRKVQLASLEFQGYALVWWDHLVKERRRTLDPAITTWEQMKALMRARFVPQHYARELRQRLENLRQGAMSAEEVYTSMQMAMVKANVVEDEESTMARYLRILNSSLANEIDLYPYSTMVELLHLAIKVEKKTKARNQGAKTSFGATSSWKAQNSRPQGSYSREPTSTKEDRKASTMDQGAQRRSSRPHSSSRPLNEPSSGPQGSTSNSTLRSRDIVCFKSIWTI